MALVENNNNMFYDHFYGKVEALSPESINSVTPPPPQHYVSYSPLEHNQTMSEQHQPMHPHINENFSPNRNTKQSLPSFSKSYSQKLCRSLDTHVVSFPTPSPESFRSTSPEVDYFNKNYVNLEVTADLFRVKDHPERVKIEEDPETLYRMNTFNTVFDYAKNKPATAKSFSKFENEFKPLDEENFDDESVLSSEDFYDEETQDEFSSNNSGKCWR